jgi:hypothetical protein
MEWLKPRDSTTHTRSAPELAQRDLSRPNLRSAPASGTPLEELHSALVFFGFLQSREGAQVAPLAGLGIDASRIQPEFAGLELTDHFVTSVMLDERWSSFVPSYGASLVLKSWPARDGKLFSIERRHPTSEQPGKKQLIISVSYLAIFHELNLSPQVARNLHRTLAALPGRRYVRAGFHDSHIKEDRGYGKS